MGLSRLVEWRRGVGLSLSCVVLLAAGACATYKPPTAGATARIKFVGGHGYAYVNEGNTCSTRQLVGKDMWASTYVKSGRRIRIEQGYDTSGLPSSYKCGFAYSFEPQAETTYVSEFERGPTRCKVGLYRLTATGERVVEPSMSFEQPSYCF